MKAKGGALFVDGKLVVDDSLANALVSTDEGTALMARLAASDIVPTIYKFVDAELERGGHPGSIVRTLTASFAQIITGTILDHCVAGNEERLVSQEISVFGQISKEHINVLKDVLEKEGL